MTICIIHGKSVFLHLLQIIFRNRIGQYRHLVLTVIRSQLILFLKIIYNRILILFYRIAISCHIDCSRCGHACHTLIMLLLRSKNSLVFRNCSLVCRNSFICIFLKILGYIIPKICLFNLHMFSCIIRGLHAPFPIMLLF